MKSGQALTIWTAVPADIRNKILSNVFCGQCGVDKRGLDLIKDKVRIMSVEKFLGGLV